MRTLFLKQNSIFLFSSNLKYNPITGFRFSFLLNTLAKNWKKSKVLSGKEKKNRNETKHVLFFFSLILQQKKLYAYIQKKKVIKCTCAVEPKKKKKEKKEKSLHLSFLSFSGDTHWIFTLKSAGKAKWTKKKKPFILGLLPLYFCFH